MNRFAILTTSISLLSSAFAQDHKEAEKRAKEPRKGPPRPEEFLKGYDQNADQKISKEEFATGERAARLDPVIREKIFKRLDKNDDGFISIEELKKMTPKKGRHSLGKADLDKDGRISKEEFVEHEHFAEMPAARRDEIFARLDRNGDGFLDKEEGQRGGRKGGRGGERNHPRLKINELDLDKDGFLSFEEFQTSPAMESLSEDKKLEVFRKIDSDEDQKISPKEIRTAHERRSGQMEKKLRSKN